ncbi:HNH endonuclease [Sporosarcina sp. 6E9]|uniref:HNH endonuclease n=1 Tax=Sporosarcina sp. 6E9 TaxID=2819235 RepID=UPI0034CFCEEE
MWFFNGVIYIRADRKGAHRANYERNRKRIFATQNTCGICGHPVDFSLKVPHPMSATADHIIPVAKNGHPSDIDNLQLAHWTCNRQKSDKIFKQGHETKRQVVGNRNLPQSINWMNYNSNQPQQVQEDKKEEKQGNKRTVVRVRRRV